MSFVVEREKEIQEWNEQKLPKVLPGYSGGRLPGRSTQEKGREEGKVDEDGGERRIRKEIVQEVVVGMKEKANAHDEAKATAQRTAGQSVMRSWDCSQIGSEEEEEEELWQKENQMELQWAEGEKLEESLEQRRMERCFFAGGSHAKGTRIGEGEKREDESERDGAPKR